MYLNYKTRSLVELNDLLKNEKSYYKRRKIYGELVRKRFVFRDLDSSFDTNSFIEKYTRDSESESECERDNESECESDSYLPLIPPRPVIQPTPHLQYQEFDEDFWSELELPPPLESNYEVMSQLEPVKLGLVSKDLVEKSIIRNSHSLELCVVCQELIFLDIVRELDCKHCFHVDCIDTWFINKNDCPICKNIIGDSKFN